MYRDLTQTLMDKEKYFQSFFLFQDPRALKSVIRFSDNLDRLYIANSDFDPINIFSDNLIFKETGILHSFDNSMNGLMEYYLTQSNMIRLFWRTVSPFDRPATDIWAAGFRLLAYPGTGIEMSLALDYM